MSPLLPLVLASLALSKRHCTGFSTKQGILSTVWCYIISGKYSSSQYIINILCTTVFSSIVILSLYYSDSITFLFRDIFWSWADFPPLWYSIEQAMFMILYSIMSKWTQKIPWKVYCTAITCDVNVYSQFIGFMIVPLGPSKCLFVVEIEVWLLRVSDWDYLLCCVWRRCQSVVTTTIQRRCHLVARLSVKAIRSQVYSGDTNCDSQWIYQVSVLSHWACVPDKTHSFHVHKMILGLFGSYELHSMKHNVG